MGDQDASLSGQLFSGVHAKVPCFHAVPAEPVIGWIDL